MKVSDLAFNHLSGLLDRGDLVLRTGPFDTTIHSPLACVHHGIAMLYADFEVPQDPVFSDFHVRVAPPAGLRRWVGKQVLFHYDDEIPFKPLPQDQAFPMLEWGMNWSISTHAHQYLVIHAAAIERGGRAVIMPAPPGSGKSTLCAALIHHGWRLLSDELALLSPIDGTLTPLTRPVSLKNQSIDIVRGFGPEIVIGPLSRDTLKGTVAHMRPPAASVHRARETALPAWIVFPKYRPGAGAILARHVKAQTLMALVENTFNYQALGETAFRALSHLVDRCDCYTFEYDRMERALEMFSDLADCPD